MRTARALAPRGMRAVAAGGPFAIPVPARVDGLLRSQHGAAHGAVAALRKARIRAGGGHGGIDCRRVPFIAGIFRVAALAVIDFLAAGCVVDKVMPRGGNHDTAADDAADGLRAGGPCAGSGGAGAVIHQRLAHAALVAMHQLAHAPHRAGILHHGGLTLIHRVRACVSGLRLRKQQA